MAPWENPPSTVVRGSAPNCCSTSLMNASIVSRAGARPLGISWERSRTRPAIRSACMRAMSISHQARASVGPKLNESGPSGKKNLVPVGTFTTSASDTRSSPGAPKPCRSRTRGPWPPPFPSVPPVTRVRSPPMYSSRMSSPLFHIQILQQRDDAVEEGFDDGLLVERHERTLLVSLDFADDVLDLFRTNFVVLPEPESLNHLLAQPSQHRPLRPVGRLIEQQRPAQRQHDIQCPGQQQQERVVPDIEVVVARRDHDQQRDEGVPDEAIDGFRPSADQVDSG